MSDKLKQVVSYFVDNNYTDGPANDPENEIGQTIKTAAKQRIMDDIYSEIYNKVEEEAYAQAEKRSKEMAVRRRLKEIRNLIIQGFILAFFVGLAANQMTEIIKVWKTSVMAEDFMKTWTLFFVFVAICVAIIVYVFFKDLVGLIRKDVEE
ncbi:MAG: hypothetical protein ACI4LC_02335 [Emergencia sp.]